MTFNQPLRYYVTALLIVLGATCIAAVFRDLMTLANFTTFYMLIILILAIRYGTGPALVAAFVSLAAINFFLISPIYNISVADPRELFDLWIFVVTAAIAGQLGARVKQQAEEAQKRADEQEILYHLTREFNQQTADADVFQVLTKAVQTDLGAHSAQIASSGIETTQVNQGVYMLPLQLGEQSYGQMQAVFNVPLGSSQLNLLRTCVSLAAMALKRIDLTAQANKSRQFEEADKLKTAILHAVSHDLRTPITVIKSSANNLQHMRATLSRQQEDDIAATIENEADELNKLVGNLLDMSRLQAGAFSLNNSPNSLEEIAEDVAARVWELTKQERIRLVFDETLPLVDFDYGLVLQAVSNLVDNAIRYEPPDERIEICGLATSGEVTLKIINHGENISEEAKTRIMDPFYRGAGGRIGLGLPIAKGIIEAHRGHLRVEDTQGGGATFVIALPHQGT